MSWFNTSLVARRLPVLVTLASMLLLGGCIEPMYSSMGGNLAAELRAVAVDPVPDRLGHYLHDQLITNFNGTGESVPPKYRLTLKPRERVQSALVDVVTQRTQNGTIITDIDYTLTPVDAHAPIASGTVTSAASYNRSEQRYANIAASHDAEIRDAKTLADQLTTRVAAALASPRRVPDNPVKSPQPPAFGVSSDATVLPGGGAPGGGPAATDVQGAN